MALTSNRKLLFLTSDIALSLSISVVVTNKHTHEGHRSEDGGKYRSFVRNRFKLILTSNYVSTNDKSTRQLKRHNKRRINNVELGNRYDCRRVVSFWFFGCDRYIFVSNTERLWVTCRCQFHNAISKHVDVMFTMDGWAICQIDSTDQIQNIVMFYCVNSYLIPLFIDVFRHFIRCVDN